MNMEPWEGHCQFGIWGLVQVSLGYAAVGLE